MPRSEGMTLGSGGSSALAARLSLYLAQTTLGFTRVPLYTPLMSYWQRRRFGRAAAGARPFAATTADGERLAALHLPADPQARRAAAREPLPVLCAHGYIETKERHLPRALELTRRGHDVILYDHRAHGRSTGRCTTLGALERRDASAVFDEAQRQGIVGPRVIDLGFSLGAATLLQHAAIDPRVAAVVALAPFVDALTALRCYRQRHAPFLNEDWLLRGFAHAARHAGFALEASSTAEAIAQLRAPVLLIVGECDRHLSPALHTRVLREAARGPCRLIEVPGATHLTLARSRWPGLDEAIFDFCAQAQ